MVSVAEYIGNSIAIVIGAYIIYVMIDAFCKTESGFCEYGWLIMGAYIAGVIVYLKYALGGRQ